MTMQKIKDLGFKLWAVPFFGLLALLPTKASASVSDGLNFISGPFSGTPHTYTFRDLASYVIDILLTVAGAIAVVFLVYGGFLYLTSGGNEEQAEKGKKSIVNSLIGLVVIILSFVIVNVVNNLVGRNQF